MSRERKREKERERTVSYETNQFFTTRSKLHHVDAVSFFISARKPSTTKITTWPYWWLERETDIKENTKLGGSDKLVDSNKLYSTYWPKLFTRFTHSSPQCPLTTLRLWGQPQEKLTLGTWLGSCGIPKTCYVNSFHLWLLERQGDTFTLRFYTEKGKKSIFLWFFAIIKL
jgi:hypothetical protein